MGYQSLGYFVLFSDVAHTNMPTALQRVIILYAFPRSGVRLVGLCVILKNVVPVSEEKMENEWDFCATCAERRKVV